MPQVVWGVGGGRPARSKDVARERLKLVLVQDRAEANRGFLEKLKDDIIEVVARHADIDPARVEVKFLRSESQNILLARIPVTNLKRVT
jgi:cell division topological specificity factor